MKALMMFGAIVGFLIGCGFGLAGSSPWPATLWHACAASVVAAVLARWWSRVWMESLREALEQRHHARPQAVPAAKPAAKV